VKNMTKWEYENILMLREMKRTGLLPKQILDKYGLEGWELVAVVRVESPTGMSGQSLGEGEVGYWLKREKR
jgi:hypothetical protein